MEPEEADAITSDRLARWRAKLKAETATPMVLVGVSHGERSGALVVLVPEDVPAEDAALLASKAAIGLANLARAEARAGGGRRNPRDRRRGG